MKVLGFLKFMGLVNQNQKHPLLLADNFTHCLEVWFELKTFIKCVHNFLPLLGTERVATSDTVQKALKKCISLC